MNAPSNTYPPPIWSDGFAIGHGRHRITIYFISGQPDLSDEALSGGTEAPTSPTFHSPVTMSHATARQLLTSLSNAFAEEVVEETAEEAQ